MRHIAYAMMKKLKDIVTNNELYTLREVEIPKWPTIRSLRQSHRGALPFVFSELPDSALQAFNIAKPVPPPMEVINVDNAGTSSVGKITEMSADNADPVVQQGTQGFKAVPNKKRQTTLSVRLNKKRKRVMPVVNTDEGDDGQLPSHTVKTEDVLFDVEPAEQDNYDEATKAAFDTLSEDLEKIVHVYTSDASALMEAHEDTAGENLEGSVDLYLTDPPYGIRRELDKTNSSYDTIHRSTMKAFGTDVSRYLKRGAVMLLCSAPTRSSLCGRKFSAVFPRRTLSRTLTIPKLLPRRRQNCSPWKQSHYTSSVQKATIPQTQLRGAWRI